MGGKGPAPKPEHRRARKNKPPTAVRVISSDPTPQPPLPECMPDGRFWPPATKAWWEMWGNDPLSAEFRPTDWSELLDTAVIHGRYWSGDIKLANELRLRTARFGATQEDRARLRIQYATADEAEAKRDDRRARSSSASSPSTAPQYSKLKAVD